MTKEIYVLSDRGFYDFHNETSNDLLELKEYTDSLANQQWIYIPDCPDLKYKDNVEKWAYEYFNLVMDTYYQHSDKQFGNTQTESIGREMFAAAICRRLKV